jgi:anthranilate phosphoribosyltransferase
MDRGIRRRIVVLNAALAIVAGGRAESLREGIEVAEACIDEGGARRKLQGLIEMSNS